MTTGVFYSAWQLQCCGAPFSVGDLVSWTAIPSDGAQELNEIGPAEASGIEWYEEHHNEPDDPVSSVEGTIVGIRAIWQRYEPSTTQRMMSVPVWGDVYAEDRTKADGWESDGDQSGGVHRVFTGYVVRIEQSVGAS